MARQKKYRAVHTVHYGCYRFEAGTEFTSDDLQPPKGADAALEPLPERELQDWLESGRGVDITPKPKPRKASKKKAVKPRAATVPIVVEAASDPKIAEGRVKAGVKVPKYANWRKEE